MRDEKYIRGLLDFQKFEGNEELGRVIDSVAGKRSGIAELTEDELGLVAAAGASGTNSDVEMGAKIQSDTHFLPVVCRSSVCKDKGTTFYITGKGSHTVVCPYCKMKTIIAG